MVFKRAILPITPAQQAMHDKMREAGCIQCRERGYWTQGEIHHLTRSGMQLGHEYTLCSCVWHHKAHVFQDLRAGFETPAQWLREHLGPSLAESKVEHAIAFGDDQTLLDKQRDAIGYPRIQLPERAQRRRKGSTLTPSKILKRSA